MPKRLNDLFPSANGIMKIKNMRNILLCGLYFVLSLKGVVCESDYEIKRGIYPYMAVVYYPDVTILGSSGARFSRSAVVIRPEWLISSSLETNDTQLAFPLKTLMARVGAIVIDSNFTVNEDEGEQDREIIQIIRPTNFTVSRWWENDITLLKTLMPFMMTPTVKSTTLAGKTNSMDKTCYILIFAKKYRNATDDKLLMQLTVELLPPSTENCGTHFRNETMICASNSEENKNIAYEPDFCHNNDGGPLICEGDVIGLQTYIDKSCKQPYLYQHLSAWDDFITCGIEDKYRIQQYATICTSIDKDDEAITFGTNEIITMPTAETSRDITIDQSTEESNDEDRLILSDSTTLNVTTVNDNETPSPTTLSTTEKPTTKDTTPLANTENEEKTTHVTEEAETGWPKEKLIGYRKKLDEAASSENLDRSTNVEAQRHEAKKKGRSGAECYVIGKMGLIRSLLFGVLFFICII